jgi:hypothetical protein
MQGNGVGGRSQITKTMIKTKAVKTWYKMNLM